MGRVASVRRRGDVTGNVTKKRAQNKKNLFFFYAESLTPTSPLANALGVIMIVKSATSGQNATEDAKESVKS